MNRKRNWPKGYLAESEIERTKSSKEITKILAKTKLLALVPDEFRHILGNDTARRGVFDLFDLFQHKSLNKRFLFILIENLSTYFFINGSSSSQSNSILPYLYQLSTNSMQPNNASNFSQTTSVSSQQQQSSSNPLFYIIRLHLSKSSRVKQEWKIVKICQAESTLYESGKNRRTSLQNQENSSNSNLDFNGSSFSGLTIDSTLSSFSARSINKLSSNESSGNNLATQSSRTSIPRSKSLLSEIKC